MIRECWVNCLDFGDLMDFDNFFRLRRNYRVPGQFVGGIRPTVYSAPRLSPGLRPPP